MMSFEVKKENDVEVADWRQQQQQHQHYENYGKTEQVFDSQLPLCWYCSSSLGDNDYYSMFEGLPSLSENGFSLPTLPESPQPQVSNPSDTPVAAGCGLSHHSHMEIPFAVPDQYQSLLNINLPDQNSKSCSSSTNITWREFETGFSAYTLKVDYLPQLVNTGYSLQSSQVSDANNYSFTLNMKSQSSQVSDANNYSFTRNMSSFNSSISSGKSPATDSSLLPEITNTENPENLSSQSNSDSDSLLKDTDVKKRKRNSSRQRRTINGLSYFTSKEKRQKLQDGSARPLYDEFDFNSKVRNYKNLKFLLQKELRNSDVGPLGRMILPKKEAEANLPSLTAKEGIYISMQDMDLSKKWSFKYRFWPNNKSRMYVLENTGEFVKIRGLTSGDFIILYKDEEKDIYIIRARKRTNKQMVFDQVRCENECEIYENHKNENQEPSIYTMERNRGDNIVNNQFNDVVRDQASDGALAEVQVKLNEGIQVNNAIRVEIRLESSEGETDDGVMYHGIMPEFDELFPKDFDLTTAMLELLPKDLHFSNDLFFESIPSFGGMPFFDGFNPDVCL